MDLFRHNKMDATTVTEKLNKNLNDMLAEVGKKWKDISVNLYSKGGILVNYWPTRHHSTYQVFGRSKGDSIYTANFSNYADLMEGIDSIRAFIAKTENVEKTVLKFRINYLLKRIVRDLTTGDYSNTKEFDLFFYPSGAIDTSMKWGGGDLKYGVTSRCRKPIHRHFSREEFIQLDQMELAGEIYELHQAKKNIKREAHLIK